MNFRAPIFMAVLLMAACDDDFSSTKQKPMTNEFLANVNNAFAACKQEVEGQDAPAKIDALLDKYADEVTTALEIAIHENRSSFEVASLGATITLLPNGKSFRSQSMRYHYSDESTTVQDVKIELEGHYSFYRKSVLLTARACDGFGELGDYSEMESACSTATTSASLKTTSCYDAIIVSKIGDQVYSIDEQAGKWCENDICFELMENDSKPDTDFGLLNSINGMTDMGYEFGTKVMGF